MFQAFRMTVRGIVRTVGCVSRGYFLDDQQKKLPFKLMSTHLSFIFCTQPFVLMTQSLTLVYWGQQGNNLQRLKNVLVSKVSKSWLMSNILLTNFRIV